MAQLIPEKGGTHMSIAAKIGKRMIRLTHGFVNIIVLVIILLLLVFASYAIWDTNQVHQAANAERYEKFKPSVEDEGASFDQLHALNPEVFAWLTVYGTHIDYPVEQGPDNLKYVNTDALGNYSLSGAIFLDSKNSMDFSDFNSILYGHHMEKMTMFGEIGEFSDKPYFDARKYGMLYYNGLEHGLEFFAFVHTDAYDPFVFRVNLADPAEQQAYLDMLLQTAKYVRKDVPVSIDDRIVLLSTCSEVTTNGRDLLVGRITDEVYEDAFAEENPAQRISLIQAIDGLPGLFEQAPLWVKIATLVLPLLLIVLIIILIVFRRRRRNGTRHGGD